MREPDDAGSQAEGLTGTIDGTEEFVLLKHHQALIYRRYTAGNTIEAIASATRQTVDAVYCMLSRVRSTLRECVAGKLAAGAR